MPKFEEQIGVKIPGQGHYMVSIAVGPFDTDEEVLARISTRVGTIFNVTGTKYEVVCSSPFKLKKLTEKSESEEDEPPPKKSRAPKEAKPTNETPPPLSKRRDAEIGPQVGETWKPKDPRRIASFVIVSVEADHVVTDDGRTIQLARFLRYERLKEASSKAS
jgi:hypothetical protein